MRTTSQSLFDLAPNGVYKHFEFLQNLVVSYTTISPLPEGGLFSVALSIIRQGESLPVREHPVLRCPDFPPLDRSRGPRVTIRPTQFLNNDLIYRIIFTIKESSTNITSMNSRISTNFCYFLHRDMCTTPPTTVPGEIHNGQSISRLKYAIVN